MGGTNQKFTSDYLVFRSNYNSEKTILSQNFSPYKILQNKFKPSLFILEKTKYFLTKEELDSSIKYITQAIDLKHENICEILYHCQSHSNNICIENNLSHTIAVEYSLQNLHEFIINNKKNNKSTKSITSFNDNKGDGNKILDVEHMWYVLKSLLEGISHLVRYNIPTGVITPKNVFITEEGEIKFMNSFYIDGFVSNLSKGLSVPEFKACYSPEELLFLKRNFFNYDLDNEKSLVFSIGLIVLSVAVSEDFESFYDFEGYGVNFKRILKRVNGLKVNGYPDSFIDILVGCLLKEPGERFRFQYLKAKINKLINPNKRRGFSFFF